VPKSATSNNRAKGLFDKRDFESLPEKDEYRCPAGQRYRSAAASSSTGPGDRFPSATYHKSYTAAMARTPLLSERRVAARLGVLLVFALLFAQTGALLHQYRHLRAPGAPPASGQTCADCLSFSPLLTAAGGATHLLVMSRAQTGISYRSPSVPAFVRPPQHAFLPRGPPSLA
jgi:hypothetical protein